MIEQDLNPTLIREWLGTPAVSSFIAGGIAGALSRTVVAPFERMKIIFQLQGPGQAEYNGVYATLAKMYREEGWRGFMRGNGINVIRMFPYSAVQFTSYTTAKSAIQSFTGQDSGVAGHLVAGAFAGVASVTATYPLDLVRTRLSIQTASIGNLHNNSNTKPPGLWQTAIHIYRTEGGFRALYRGLIVTSAGVAPYIGLNFTLYEYFKSLLSSDNQKLSPYASLASGALSGSISQTLTYPADVLRRRFQVLTMDKMAFQYKSSWDAIKGIVKVEGWAGLYKGIMPNLLKVAPAMAVSFWSFEFVKHTLAYP